MTTRSRSGPMEGHWTETLRLIDSSDDGKAFVCKSCVSNGVNRERATLRSAHNASNLYSHLKQVHPEIYSVLTPIVQGRERNKKPMVQSTTITEVMARSTKRVINDAFVRLFASPDLPKRLLENARFKTLLRAINSNVKVPTRSTLNSWLWDKFRVTINRIKDQVQSAEYTVLIFDGWSTFRNEAVLGFMISLLSPNLTLETYCLGNFIMKSGHGARHVSEIITQVVRERLGGRIPDYFVSDSAPVNKAAVRQFMNDEGDEYWYPCGVHFCQLAMKESVAIYLAGSSSSDEGGCDDDWEELSEDEVISRVRTAVNENAFSRITTTCRAIRASVKRSHAYANLFRDCQKACDINVTIATDVCTRFDSTLAMLASVHINQNVLQRMQERGRRDVKLWPVSLHLSADDFTLIGNVVKVLEPIQNVTKQLSLSTAWIGDVLPLMTSAIDAVINLDVSTDASRLKNAVVDALSMRIQMLLGVEQELPCAGGNHMGCTTPTEFVLAAILNLRFSSAIHACYGYNDRVLIQEMKRLYKDRIGGNSMAVNEVNGNMPTENVSAEEMLAADAWANRITSGQSAGPSNVRYRRGDIRSEFMAFRSEIGGRRFTAEEGRQFWHDARTTQRFMRLGRLARLLMTVPASAIPQERQFSELKRRCNGLRNRTKVDILDRD
eukprot:IDg23086t1